MRWDAIHKRIKNIKNPIGAEIGVYKGELSENILSLKEDLKWVMIDPWSEKTYEGKPPDAVSEKFKIIYETEGEASYFLVLKKMIKYYSRGLPVKFNSGMGSQIFNDHFFDIVFIDAAHDFDSVMLDLILWWKKVKPGGYLSGHDYGVENFPGVKRAVDVFFAPHFARIETDDDYTWFVRK